MRPPVSLARAREKAADNRTAVAAGRGPLATKHALSMPTFREAARAVHEVNRPRWRNAKHIANWMQTLERHAIPALGNTPLDRLDSGDVLRVLNPIWTTRPETARRVRQRTPFSLEIAALNRELLAWEHTYNTVRPREALGYLTPA